MTPYVGAGIGGAWVKWDTLHNTDLDGSFEHTGGKDWRFAYALMAGASYCLTDRVKLDVGYRYSHINGGKMFDYASDSNVGPGYDDGINVNEVRGGLRYQFGRSDCAPPGALCARAGAGLHEVNASKSWQFANRPALPGGFRLSGLRPDRRRAKPIEINSLTSCYP